MQKDGRNYVTPKQFVARNIYFFGEPKKQEALGALTHGIRQEELLGAADGIMATSVEDWTHAQLEVRIKEAVTGGESGEGGAEKQRAWTRALYHLMRLALMDGQDGPSLANTMMLLGRDTCRDRYRAYRAERG